MTRDGTASSRLRRLPRGSLIAAGATGVSPVACPPSALHGIGRESEELLTRSGRAATTHGGTGPRPVRGPMIEHDPLLDPNSRQVLLRLGQRVANDADQAEDLVQEAYLARLRRRSEVVDGRRWLGGAVIRLGASHRRDEARRRYREGRYAGSREMALDPRESEEREHAVQALSDALRGLPEAQLEAIQLRFFEECSYAEAGERLGVPPETVRTRTKRGLVALRSRLDARHLAVFTPALLGKAQVPLGASGSGLRSWLGAAPKGAATALAAIVILPLCAVLALWTGLLDAGSPTGAASPDAGDAARVADAEEEASDGTLDALTPGAGGTEVSRLSGITESVEVVEAPEPADKSIHLLLPDGQPAAGAKVWIVRDAWPALHMAAQMDREHDLVADEEGAVSVEHLEAGDALFAATDDAHVILGGPGPASPLWSSLSWSLTRGDALASIEAGSTSTMVASTALEVVVRNDLDRPVANARVVVLGERFTRRNGRTGPDGTLRIEHLPRGAWIGLRVTRQGRAIGFLGPVHLSTPQQPIEMTLDPGISRRFRLEDGEGRPYPGCRVQLVYGDSTEADGAEPTRRALPFWFRNVSWDRSGRTGTDGLWTERRLRKGRYSLRVLDGSRRLRHESDLVISGPDSTLQVIRLEEARLQRAIRVSHPPRPLDAPPLLGQRATAAGSDHPYVKATPVTSTSSVFEGVGEGEWIVWDPLEGMEQAQTIETLEGEVTVELER